ncbi:MAG: hypothetical protein CSA26_07620 [Desulfobacterales bacterium]|nr:MAG: hypothetical protein CSA26_07620 [Desulfobacterales bacterium]
MDKGIALRFEGGPIFRNVRPLSALLEEFQQKNIEFVHVDPTKLKYASWNLVLVFKDKETRDQYSAGKLEYKAAWLPGMRKETHRINPLKAAKRAARRS